MRKNTLSLDRSNAGEMFNLPCIKNIVWKKVHVGIEKSNFGEGQLLNHIILLIKYMIFVSSKANNNPPTRPQDMKRRILENNQEGKNSEGERKMGQFPV